ncbi:hypothetical protein JB92DRAFT_2824870 [Gautieria morchelliformis]|nr:hypothetical protein JB92DRAFT_2824870 [Gautieria morchelliformis]
MPVPASDPFAPAWADPWTVKVWDHLTSTERTEWLEANPTPPAQPSAKYPPVQGQARTRGRPIETTSASASKNKCRKIVDVIAKAGGTMGNMGEPRGGGHTHEQNTGHPDADKLPDTLNDLMNQAAVEEDQEVQQLRMVQWISTHIMQAISGTMSVELQGIRDELAVLQQANSKLTAVSTSDRSESAYSSRGFRSRGHRGKRVARGPARNADDNMWDTESQPGDWEVMKERGLTGQYKTFKKEILVSFSMPECQW